MDEVQLIGDRLQTSKSFKKSYADMRRKQLEFQVDEWIFLESVTYEWGDEI